MLAGQTSGSGIFYMDIEPNFTMIFDYPASGDIYYLDINDDGVEDFKLTFSGSASPGHQSSSNSIIPLNNNSIVSPHYDNTIADTLCVNDTINNNVNWSNNPCILFSYYSDETASLSSTGLWNNINIK